MSDRLTIRSSSAGIAARLLVVAVIVLSLGSLPGIAAPSSPVLPFFQAITPGLQGEYWGPGLAALPATPGVPAGAPDVTRTDTTVDFADATFPVPYAAADDFVVRWTGWVLAPITGAVTFYTNTDDGVELVINNVAPPLISDWADQSPTDNQGNFNMTQNFWYPIRLTFYENSGGAECHLTWSYTNQARTVIPSTNLSATAPPPPPAPTLSISTPQNYSPIINLSWTSVNQASSYDILKSTQSGLETPYASVAAPTTTYQDTNVQFNSTYFYVVRANVNGQASNNSNEVSGMPQAFPPRTQKLGGKESDCGCGSVGTPGFATLSAGFAALALLLLALRR